jgi:hypothetical protein
MLNFTDFSSHTHQRNVKSLQIASVKTADPAMSISLHFEVILIQGIWFACILFFFFFFFRLTIIQNWDLIFLLMQPQLN